MKNNPKRHKASNTFRFESFSERISKIKIDVHHKVKHVYEEDDDVPTTYYSQCLSKWINESFCPDFVELSKQLPRNISLPQLLARKNEVANILIDHLKKCDIESLQPALELIVAVARDLRNEFYPFFSPSILRECVRLLDTREPDQIEWIFKCLVHLFKYLRSAIIKNINSVLPELLPLLGNSKPVYIINFAAESFAFVARKVFKVEEKSRFLNLCLKNIKDSNEELCGVARLFFEVIRNVGYCFHSETEEFLYITLKELQNPKWSKVLFPVCDHLVSNIISFVSAKTDVSPLWGAFMRVAKEFCTAWSQQCDEENSANLVMVLKLVERLTTSREVTLRNPLELLSFMLPLATDPRVKNFRQLHSLVIDIISHLLTNTNFSSRIPDYCNVIEEIFKNIRDDELIVRFSEKIVAVPKYELLILSHLLTFINGHGLNNVLIEFLSKVVWMKTNFQFNKTNETALNAYKQCLRLVPETFTEAVTKEVQANVCPETYEMILHAVIVSSHIEKSHSDVAKEVDKVLEKICVVISSCERVEDVAKLLYILLLSVQCRAHCMSAPANCDGLIQMAAKFISSANYLCSLRILDSLSPFSAFKCLHTDAQKNKLINNLCSPFHKVRLFTLHVLMKMQIHPVFEHLYLIESTQPSIETYRDKLHKLQKLESTETFRSEIQDEVVKSAVLKFLFGNLYINFQYMWEPIQRLILSHLENDGISWSLYEYQLSDAVTNDMDSVKLMENLVVDFKCDFLQEHFYEVNGVDDRPDFYNFRCLLLDVLSNCKNFRFQKNDFILELFLKFYNSEYTANVYKNWSSCNIKKLNDDVKDDEFEDNSDIIKDERKSKNLNKLFMILLKLINNVSHQIPQKRREEIFNIHFELLSNGNSGIQGLAVNYICKVRKMTTHRDRLLLLTKENTFKTELLNVRMDFSSDIITERDQDFFLKIILKMIHGKIRKKTAVHLRDSMFEFLAGCDDKYILSFFDMFFKEFSPFIKDHEMPSAYFSDEIDLENTFSPSCLLSYVNTALDLLKRCGKLLKHTCLSYLLKVILKVAANMVILLQAKSEVHAGYYGVLSKIRIVSFEAIIYVFENFEYSWNQYEMEAVFQCFVEPWLHKISEECLQSPNPVLKLFIVFTKNTRYFPLLAQRHENLTPLDTIMGLLNSKKVHFNVKNSILEVIERLLTLEEESDDNDAADLMYMDNSTMKPLKKKQQYGTLLLLPYVTTILEYLENSLSKRHIKLSSIYMLILKRVSEFGLNEEVSVTLLNLLMPVLKSRATADEDVVMPLLDTIFNLFKTFKNYDSFEVYLLQMTDLFNVVTIVSVRKALCDIIKYISQKTGNKFVNGDFVQGLNLIDLRWLDQPDYGGRLETFKNINAAAEKDELNLYTGVFVIYNCFYMIKNEKDMALRDHSALCLKRICPILVNKYSASTEQFHVLLNETLLPLIKEGVHSKIENYQSESVLLLGHMVRECNRAHAVFKDLHVLSDVSNLEYDFFENILHLQHHRRTKALKRFNEIMSLQMKPPQPYSLMFIFPLVSRCLLSEKTASEHGLINAAVEALKVVCRLSPWRHYERIFKQYVMEMRKNVSLRKQAIRIISAILDAFHFDLTNAADCEKRKPMSRKMKKKQKAQESAPVDSMEVDEPTAEILKTNEPAVKRISVLCRSDAVRVYTSIKAFLVPSLDRVFMTYEDSEQYHKLSKKSTNNDKEELAVLSIPIAYAAVKLLKRLPRALLDEYISTVFLKLSTYLKSRLMSIRLVARETMQNILLEIGPTYFPRLLSEMMAILTKGFQIHVLVFTCHAILEKIKSMFMKDQMDTCIEPILEICIVDLFGKIAEEKEVVKISSKTPEAKGNKSYNMLSILAEYISEKCILDMVHPLKEILSNNMSSKIVTKVRRCLQYIALGLTRNRFLDAESLLVFSYGVSNDCIPILVAERENNLVRVEAAIERPDSLLIPEEPRQLTAEKRKVCSRTNAHVIIEFGLELLESMLKREIIKALCYRSHLDPFVPLIKDSLQSQYNKLVVLSLKCLIYLLKRDLPSLNDNASYICDSVFGILGKYSSASVSGENAELLMSATKVALVLIRDLKHKIDNNQLRILLYVAEDLQHNISHYGTGFSLIRAIIGRQFNIQEVHDLMKRTAELSIRSYSDTVRLMARKAYYQYLMHYPHGKKLQQHVMFFTSQLKYEELPGRKSALEMLTALINVFPLDVLQNLCSVLFVQLAFRLIQDDSPECKEMVSTCISRLVARFQDTKQERELLDIPLIWINEKNVLNRRLAIQLIGIFVSVQKEKFDSKLNDVLPLIEKQLYPNQLDGPGKFVRAPQLNDPADSKAKNDELIFQVLQLYKTIIEVCPVVLNSPAYTNHVQVIADRCQLWLRHSHEWVRLGATQVLGLIFKSMDPSTAAAAINHKIQVPDAGFLLNERAKEQIKSLCLDFCDQLAPGYDVMEHLLKQTMKNLLFLADVLSHVPSLSRKELSLAWLVNRLVKQVYIEIANAPQKYTVRTMVFKWLAAIAVKFDSDKLAPLLSLVLLPVIRELSTTDDQGIEIRRMAKEVLKYYRQKASSDEYDQTITKVQRLLDAKRAKRKIKITQMAVVHPEQAAKRKQKIQVKKKEQRKRRLEKLRKRKFKSGKKKLVEIPIS